MTLGERIRKVRKDNGLTMEQFAEKIKIKPASISRLENGVNSPADRTISIICHEFRISETWLRTGQGEMHIPMDRRTEIEAIVRSVLEAEPESFKARFIEVLAALTMDEWAALEKLIYRFAVSGSAESPPLEGKNVHDWTPDEMAEEARRQAEEDEEARKRGTEEPSTSGRGNSGTA